MRLTALALAFLPSLALAAVPLDKIKLPPGFKIEAYATNIENARSLAHGPKGMIFVSSRSAGNVYAVLDKDGDQKADETVTIASGLNMPNGVAYKDGALYVAEVSRILRFDRIADTFRQKPKAAVVYDAYPTEGHHGWKFIAFGPDGWLYVPIGAPCNICENPDKRFMTIMRMRVDGKGAPEIYASGVRNSVGFDWHPGTRELWFTDNGRDWGGDDFPPDELNHAPKAGMHFGFPYCLAGGVADVDFGKKGKPCSEYTPVAQPLGAHVASLGMRFYTGTMFPAEYRNQIFIAEHGSWNRSSPSGYRVTLVRIGKDGKPAQYEVFAEGWLRDGEAWGRPVDVLVMPDGALLVSDDHADMIYRISRK
jgi:glucose/arabinose dehydrogenase